MPKFKVSFESSFRVIDAPTEDAAIEGFYNELDLVVEPSDEPPDLIVDAKGYEIEEDEEEMS